MIAQSTGWDSQPEPALEVARREHRQNSSADRPVVRVFAIGRRIGLGSVVLRGPQPAEAGRTGSAASLVKWNELGRAGREFVASGPTAAQIGALTGRPARDPLRVYVGLRGAETARARGNGACARSQRWTNSKRQGGFERSVLVAITPTGTGWSTRPRWMRLSILPMATLPASPCSVPISTAPSRCCFNRNTAQNPREPCLPRSTGIGRRRRRIGVPARPESWSHEFAKLRRTVRDHRRSDRRGSLEPFIFYETDLALDLGEPQCRLPGLAAGIS
ncbi:hypothetical protein ACVWYH_007965 [Bradyrhizobium sp. GM24.11]